MSGALEQVRARVAAQKTLLPERHQPGQPREQGQVDVSEIVAALSGFKEVDKYAKVASLQEIATNDFNLNISRYEDTSEASEKMGVKAPLANLLAAADHSGVAPLRWRLERFRV